MPHDIHFFLGGARSGKSHIAENLALDSYKAIPSHDAQLCYIATAQAFDDEMQVRIDIHKQRRGDAWRLVEAPIDLADKIALYDKPHTVMLVDCLSVWMTNLLIGDHDIEAASDKLCDGLENSKATIICVASETGLGIVPDNALSRRFRDESGLLNQRVAALADHVYFVTAGLTSKLKP
ncbi:MAG: bifunctional adenosylcobinamide kinase/adenosylcobinamide-phosphate guanylyltransferase [Candidatus Puniceispirillum sp.]|jgi:adenosylcobinamide kinase / adenosylcobinamide-phosphate guanylyltransferase|uniref:bifunctional adenosylcobinamide kinase/adenosylcobinamide-phosphate guanylyltransferase n=1 Tax=Candidatus Puniceispirillum sp. TaxID=2026719 RepID=UPI001EC67CA7|nr:bifunctional adenosylcobinamide kinase/adenosylcobinamide-phosphate guanylyltransferase [Candidatus Puniceispirillum sp.]MBT6416679.1 bifunctional adenosylcobinamide kinase/adenosylcobinamide-phosphate guanylyltransferase [Candidatus Puniceispirillum sp.]